MKRGKMNRELIRKIALVGLLTAVATVLSYIKIPLVSTATVTLVLPVVVIGAVLCGPWVGAWLTVIPTLTSFGEAALFMAYNPVGSLVTLLGKGLLSGFAAGFVYKLMAAKAPNGAVVCASLVAPVVNSGIFVLGCYVFLWDLLVDLAVSNGVGIGMLLFGLAGMNFAVELVLNIILCPTILRIIRSAGKKKSA